MTLADGAVEEGRPLTALSLFSSLSSLQSLLKWNPVISPFLLPTAKMAFAFLFFCLFFLFHFFSLPAHSAQISSSPRIANTSTVRAQTLRGVRRRWRSERKDGRKESERRWRGHSTNQRAAALFISAVCNRLLKIKSNSIVESWLARPVQEPFAEMLEESAGLKFAGLLAKTNKG